MKGKTMSNIHIFILPLVLGMAAAAIVYAGLTGKTLPLVSGTHGTIIALLIVGLAMCAFGIMQVSASGRWASPLAILGYLLGAVTLTVIISPLTGWKLPLIQSEMQAVAAAAGLMGVKFLIGTFGYFFHVL